MADSSRYILLRQLIWDYTIPLFEIELLLSGKLENAGHYTRKMLFVKILETYPWFTVLQLFSPEDIKSILTIEVIKSLRMPSLQKKYGFIQKRLQEIIPAAG
jgi:hypothetical protein